MLSSSARRLLLPELQRLKQEFKGDALPGSVAKQFNQMSQEFGGIDRTAKRLAATAAQRNLDEVDKRLVDSIKNSVGVNISPVFAMDDGIRRAMEDAVQANVELISSIPTKYFEKLQQHLTDAFTGNSDTDLAGAVYPDLHKELASRYESAPPSYFDNLDPEEVLDRVDEITENRVKLIARDQTSKMNAAFNQARQTSVGIEQYQWQTAGDERVRPEHADLDGKIFSWDDPPIIHGEPLNPGEDIDCRCVAISYIDLDAEEDDLDSNEE